MTRQTVAEFFNRYAGEFDLLSGRRNPVHVALVNRLFRRSMTRRFEKSLAACRLVEGRTILDVGCGPGHYGIELARMGASQVLGLDFAEQMVAIANMRARESGVNQVCRFVAADWLSFELPGTFDYSIVMGFMDYVRDPEPVIRKVIKATTRKALFSFPSDGGFLAWQRKVRYRRKCDLFLYRRAQVESLFDRQPVARTEIESIGRDFFVTAHITSSDQ